MGYFLLVVLALAIISIPGFICSKEAEKQGRSSGSWFFLGVFFTINAFLALKLSNMADREGHSAKVWSALGVFFGVNALISYVTGSNAEKSGSDFDCWALLGFFMGWIPFVLSFFLKSKNLQINQ